jgi:hypothetical protein
VVASRIALLESADILAIIEGDKLILWSVNEELELLTFDLKESYSFAVSPDGHQLAVPKSRMVHIFDGTPQDVVKE